jgi:hypothetical protein
MITIFGILIAFTVGAAAGCAAAAIALGEHKPQVPPGAARLLAASGARARQRIYSARPSSVTISFPAAA